MYIHVFAEFAVKYYKYFNNIHIKYDDIPLRPNGGKWIALGYDGGTPATSKFESYHFWDGPVHKLDNAWAQGFFHAWSNPDSTAFFDTPNDVFALLREITKGNVKIEEFNEEQKYLFSIALERKLFINENGTFKPTYYYINGKERKELEKMAQEFSGSVVSIVEGAYKIVLEEYEKTVPKHLHWQMGNFLSNNLYSFVTCSLFEAEKNKILSTPDENNKYWLSLFASE